MTNLEVFNNLSKQFFAQSDSIFETLFDSVSKVQGYPFYNVVKYGKGKYGIEIGLAGFNKKDVKVEVKDGVLTIEGEVDDKEVEYVQKGLAYRKFFKQFTLTNDVIVDEAEMKDGLLKIKLGYNKPEIDAEIINIK